MESKEKDLSGIGDAELYAIREMYREQYRKVGPRNQLVKWIEEVHNEIEKREKAAHEKQG